MSRRAARAALTVAIVVVLVGACTSSPPADRQAFSVTDDSRGPRPYVVWWSPYATQVENITHVVNDVWVGDPANNPDKNILTSQRSWLSRDVIPLDWAGGRVYADQGAEGLADRWTGQLRSGYIGIAIDEFGSTSGRVNRILAEALVKTRRRNPAATIAVWHSGLVDRVSAEAYRSSADMILLEAYARGTAFLGLQIGARLANIRARQLQAKTVVMLSIGDSRFASDSIDVTAQLRWLRVHIDGFAGIGFFAPRASDGLVRFTDKLVGDLW